MFNLAWFFNRSVLRSAWHAMVEKTPNVEHQGPPLAGGPLDGPVGPQLGGRT